MVSGILNGEVYTGPYIVQVDLTNRCNNNCVACWCNSPLLGDKEMDQEEKKQTLPLERVMMLLDELNQLGVREIELTGGGEPFMHPRIIEILKIIKEKEIRIGISTNFTLVDKKAAEALVELGVDHMNLSIWAATPETYVKTHPNKHSNDFKRITDIIDYIAILKERSKVIKPRLGMYNVISSYNYHEIAQMIEFAFMHKMDDITLTPVDIIEGRTESLMLKNEHRIEIRKAIAKIPCLIMRLEKIYKHRLLFENLETFAERIDCEEAGIGNYDTYLLKKLPSCYAGWSFSRILANGDVNSCLKSFKIPVGNIFQSSYHDIWFGKKQQEFRSHTIRYHEGDPYFESIGSDRFATGQGCIKCCDNLVLNYSLYNRIMALSAARGILRMVRYFKNDEKVIDKPFAEKH